MNRFDWRVTTLTDLKVVGEFEAIAKALAVQNANLTIHVMGQPLQVPLAGWRENPDVEKLIQAGGASLNLAMTEISGVPGFHQLLIARSPDGLDTLQIGYNGNAQQMVGVQIAIEAHFPRAPRIESFRTVFGEEIATYYEARERDLVRLEATIQDLLSRAADYRREMDEESAKRKVADDTRLAAERAVLQGEFDTLSAQLEADRKALDERQQSIDNRESKHARRELRKGLQQVLSKHAESFHLTKDTQDKRRPVHNLFIVALLAAAIYVAVTVNEGWGKSHDLIYALRVGVGVLGFGGTMLFYIRWVDSWFKQHSDEEFTLKRMSLDIDRASWVVETAMEWQKENDEPVPDLMLERLTSDLFARRSSSPVSHPAEDALSTVLGAAAKVRVQLPGGSSIDLDRKSARAMKEAAE